ncbi:hypothetical protein L2E82_49914 [Cichorium intybus]|uniref:Uncharacterized protein n=1 Tax=Cichorium intybus TaxID=13427 RepID=A0ACB8Z1L4_CICIN|nr:hypothetical protein L2E82_49914 [Cichorium intybus]
MVTMVTTATCPLSVLQDFYFSGLIFHLICRNSLDIIHVVFGMLEVEKFVNDLQLLESLIVPKTSNGLIGTELGRIGKDGRRPGMLEHGIDDEVTVVVCNATSPLFCNLSLDSLIRITDLDCQLLVSTSFNMKPVSDMEFEH